MSSSGLDRRPLPPARSLSGLSVLVLGASGSLGGAVATVLHGRGAGLALAGRRLDAIGRLGLPGATIPVGDLVEEGAVEKAIEHASGRGGIDGVVCCVGAISFGPLRETPLPALERLVALDLLVPLRAARAALHVLRPGGFVVNVSGVAAELPTAGLVAYSAAKAGATAGFRALAREVAAEGIEVIDVRPPCLDSDLGARALHGVPPSLPPVLGLVAAAERIVRAIEAHETELPAAAFSGDVVSR